MKNKQEHIVKANDMIDDMLRILDKAENEKWFDMPDTTDNWKTWKRIRNTITDHIADANKMVSPTTQDMKVAINKDIECSNCGATGHSSTSCAYIKDAFREEPMTQNVKGKKHWWLKTKKFSRVRLSTLERLALLYSAECFGKKPAYVSDFVIWLENYMEESNL